VKTLKLKPNISVQWPAEEVVVVVVVVVGEVVVVAVSETQRRTAFSHLCASLLLLEDCS
jgi:hypothetical protein